MIKTRGPIFGIDGKPLWVVGANCYLLSYCSSEARMPILATIWQMAEYRPRLGVSRFRHAAAPRPTGVSVCRQRSDSF